MFCPECGKQVDDGLAFCPECGAQMDGGAAPQYAAYDAAPQYGAPAYNAAPAAPAKKAVKLPGNLSPKMLGIIGGAVAAVILVIVLIVTLGGKGYEKAAMKYQEAYLNNDFKTIAKYELLDEEKFYEAMFEYDQENDGNFDDISEMYQAIAFDEDVTSYEELLQKKIDVAEENMLDQFKITNIEVKKSTELSDSKLDKLKDEIDKRLGNYDAEDLINTDKITKAYKVVVKYEYTYENDNGKEKTEKGDRDIYVVKYKGDWLVWE